MRDIQRINISDINIGDTSYKLSRNKIEERLKRSINLFGVIEPPLLYKKKRGEHIILFGHNRLKILNESGSTHVNAVIINKINPALYVSNAMIKNYRNEMGPIGKLKFIRICSRSFNLDHDEIIRIEKNGFNIPRELIENGDLIDSAIDLPDDLKDYLDCRDIGYKTIRDILRLPREMKELLGRWMKSADMRVNLFRGAVDMILDIINRDRTGGRLLGIDIESIEDRRSKEEILFHEISKIRYPEYTSLRDNADEIISKLKSRGIDIDFPAYFEGDAISIKINLSKRDAGALKEKLRNVDINEISRLLELL